MDDDATAILAERFEEQVDETFASLARAETVGGDTVPLEPVKHVSLTEKLAAIATHEGFEVDRILGRGGMGAVMLAKDRGLGRMVALKFLALPDMADSKALDGLRKEAERAGQLAHENIVHVYSWHSVGPLTFFAMEYVDGDNLQQLVQREAKIPDANILRIMAEACDGVAAAHDAGLLHRDIKPQNIMVSKTGRVKVADFGLASTDTEERTRTHVKISGTLGFMAPEQARGESCTRAGDVYGLAAALYYALAKVTPYGPMNSAAKLLMKNQQGDYKPLDWVRPGLRPELYSLMSRGLDPDPLRRIPDAATMRREIERIMLLLHEAPPKPKLSEKLKLPKWLNLPCLAVGFTLGVLTGAVVVWGFISFF